MAISCFLLSPSDARRLICYAANVQYLTNQRIPICSMLTTLHELADKHLKKNTSTSTLEYWSLREEYRGKNAWERCHAALCCSTSNKPLGQSQWEVSRHGFTYATSCIVRWNYEWNKRSQWSISFTRFPKQNKAIKAFRLLDSSLIICTRWNKNRPQWPFHRVTEA